MEPLSALLGGVQQTISELEGLTTPQINGSIHQLQAERTQHQTATACLEAGAAADQLWAKINQTSQQLAAQMQQHAHLSDQDRSLLQALVAAGDAAAARLQELEQLVEAASAAAQEHAGSNQLTPAHAAVQPAGQHHGSAAPDPWTCRQAAPSTPPFKPPSVSIVFPHIKLEQHARPAQQEPSQQQHTHAPVLPAGVYIKQEPMPAQQQQRLEDPMGQHGPAALRLVREAQATNRVCGVPNQQQMAYFDLADQPFDARQLQDLHQEKLMPFVAERFVAAAQRSRVAREALVQVWVKQCRVELHYPQLAPAILQLRDAVPGLKAERAAGRKAQATAPAECEAASKLLLVLRCLVAWEQRRVLQAQVPLLLQQLLDVGPDSVQEVVEVVDLVSEEDEEQQLQQMMDSGTDVLLTRIFPGAHKRPTRRVAGRIKKERGC